MGLPNAVTVSLWENDVRFVIPWHLHWRELWMDTVYFSFMGFFSRILAFHVPLILPRSSLSNLQEVCYLPLLDFCLHRPSVGICRALFSWHTSVTFLTRLKSPPDISNVYTHWCDAHGPDGNYSTCSCLFFLLEYWLVLAIAGRDLPLSASRLAQLALLEQ